MAPKAKKKNKSKIKDKKSNSKSTTPQRSQPLVCQTFPDDEAHYEPKIFTDDTRLYDFVLSEVKKVSGLTFSTKLSKPLSLFSTQPSSPTTSSPSPKSPSSTRSSLSPIRSNLSSTKLSLSPTRSNPSSTRSSLSPRRLSCSSIRSPLSPTKGSQRLFEEENVSLLDSKALSSIDNDESEWTQVTKKGFKKFSKKIEQRLEKSPNKKRGYFLSNQLSPSRTPPDEELEYIQDQRLVTSSNQVKTLLVAPNLTNLVGIELQMKSHSSSPILNRPLKKGIIGMCVEVIANHFKCTKLPNENISTYSFEFEPPIKSKSLQWTIKREWESKYGDAHLGGKCIIYDGSKHVYINQSLSFIARHFTYQHYDNKEGLKTYKINMILNTSQENEKSTNVTLLQPYLLTDYLNNQSNYYPQPLMTVLNLTLKQNICVGDIEFANLLFTTLKNNVAKGLLGMPNIRVLQGYFQNLKPTQQGLALNVDTCQGLFHEKSNVLDFLKNMLDYKEDIQNMKNILEINKTKVLKALKGLVVETNHYMDKITRNHIVIGITEESTRTLTIQTRDGQLMSIKNYFQENYQQKIDFLDLPCLILSSQTKNYMPIELCSIVGNQMVKDEKSFEYSIKFNKIMLASTRIQVISNFMKEVFMQRNNHSKNFNLEFDVKPTRTIARILPPPILDNNSIPYEHLYHWGVLNLSQKINSNTLEEFMNELIRVLKEMGVKVLKYQYTNGALFKTWPIEFMEAFYKKIWDTISQKKTNRVNLIVIVVDRKKRNPYYNEIKYWGDCIKGVPTQVIASDLISKPKLWRVYCQRLCLKINCRLGGVNVQFRSWNELQIKERVIKDIKYGRFIAFGADVTHPNIGSQNPSLVAIVGSLDLGCSYFGARFFTQKSKQEIMTSKLDSAITELLLAFKAYNRERPLPQNILYYRDGVGDCQFEDVLKIELPQIQQGASAAQSGYKPLISLIIVQKRHHTRFFLPDALNWDDKYAATLGVQKINIKPGTVVDNDVCDPQRFDFYLCSHYAIYGTPKPSHYFVIYDDSNFSADDFQNITFYLCHTFQRSITTISMPTPAYYVHIAAYRARQIYFAAQAVQKRKNHSLSMNRASTSSTTTSTNIMDIPNIHENHRSKMFFI